MRVIAKPRLRAFWDEHPASRQPLQAFYDTALAARWRSIADVRTTYPHADAVTLSCGLRVTVFNIGGNKYRLVAGIVCRTHYLYIKAVLAHAEYDREDWKMKLCHGQ